MPEAHCVDLLTDLAVIMCVAAVTTLVFQKLRQPVVLGYILAGMVVGPHLPVPLFADATLAHTLSELGVVLLMFSLGLEFSLRKLVKVAPDRRRRRGHPVQPDDLARLPGRARLRLDAATRACSAAPRSRSPAPRSSSRRSPSRRSPAGCREIVFGILIVEDLIAILLLAVLTAVASGAGLSAGALARTRRQAGRLPGRAAGRAGC